MSSTQDQSTDQNKYAHQARDYHKKMLSQLQIMSANVEASSVPFNSRTSQSSTSSSSLASLPSPMNDVIGLYDATAPFGQSYSLNTPGSTALDKEFQYQAGFPYGQLYDGRIDTAPRQYKSSFIDATQPSTFDPSLSPYGVTQPVFGFSQPQFSPSTASLAQAINPEILNNHTDEDEPDAPGSPLNSVSGSVSPLPSFDYGAIKARLRRTSEPTTFGSPPDNRGKKHRRKMTWTPGMANEGPNVPQTQKERELMELSRLEQGGAATRRERRRLQNRLAQRAFRARSKVQNAEAATHLTDLEKLAEMQADQLRKMNEALENLQRENNQLKAESWAKANAERAHYNKGAGP